MRIKLGREWQLGERIDGGGFAQVYAANLPEGAPAVAKIVPKAPGAQRELLFVDLTGVRNVIPILDSGEMEDSWVLIMPRAEKSLRQHLKGTAPSDILDAVAVLRDITTALVEMDGKVVHRDLKPENVLLLNGKWCLADFGISRYAQATTALDTRKHALSPPYAAPEQWRAERATTQTDVYSLGIIAFELLLGTLPFSGPDVHEFREQHLHVDAPRLSNVSPDLASLVSECLFKAAGARPSPANILARLERLGAGRQSPGLARLRQANLAEVERKAEMTRLESVARSQAERRKLLYESATPLLEGVWNTLKEMIKEAAPSVSAGGPTIRLNQAQLEFGRATLTPEKPWGNRHGPAFDVIGHASLRLQIPPDRHQYEGRSHSLWYCDAQEPGRFQWFETAFMISAMVPRRARQNPFAMDPGEEAAKALGTGVAEWDVAWPFTPLSGEDSDQFVDRWAGWFADAAEGRLSHPGTMPERPPHGSWRSR
jgi:serine/threonine protein kinase